MEKLKKFICEKTNVKYEVKKITKPSHLINCDELSKQTADKIFIFQINDANRILFNKAINQNIAAECCNGCIYRGRMIVFDPNTNFRAILDNIIEQHKASCVVCLEDISERVYKSCRMCGQITCQTCKNKIIETAAKNRCEEILCPACRHVFGKRIH